MGSNNRPEGRTGCDPNGSTRPIAHTVSERGRLHGLMLVEGATQAPIIAAPIIAGGH